MATHARVLCRNLKLLDFNFAQDNIPSEFEGFFAFFRIPRKPQFISILRFLLLALDEQYFGRELSQHTCPTSETALKCVISKWLRESRPAIKLPASVFSVLGYPGGATALEYLSVISSFVIASKISTIPDCTDDLVSSIHRLLRTKVRDQVTFCTVEKSLRAHLLKREDELTTAKRSLAETVDEVKQFTTNRLSLTETTGLSDLESANQLIRKCQDHQRILISEVLANRKRLETLLQDYTTFQPTLSNILEHAKTQPLPVLNAERFKTRKLPDLFAGSVKEIRPLRQDGKIDLHSFLCYADAVFSVGCQLLDLSQATDDCPNGMATDDRVIDWCSRVFQRSARLCDSPPQPFPASRSIQQSPLPASAGDLDELIQSMRSFISSHQPNESQLTPLTSYRRPSLRAVSKQLHTPSLQLSSNSDQSWAKLHQPVEAVSDLTPLRAFEFSQLSATPTTLEQQISSSVDLLTSQSSSILKAQKRDLFNTNKQTDRYSPKLTQSVEAVRDLSPLRAFEISQLSGTPTTLNVSQSIGILKSSNRNPVMTNTQRGLYDFKASFLQTEGSRTMDLGAIENIDPFDQSVSFEEYATPNSKWLHADSCAPETPVTPSERHSSIRVSFEHSGPRQTLNLNPPNTRSIGARVHTPVLQAAGSLFTAEQHVSPVKNWLHPDAGVKVTGRPCPPHLNVGHHLGAVSSTILDEKKGTTVPSCSKAELDEDIGSSNFNLFGDSMDFVDELVPSSPA